MATIRENVVVDGKTDGLSKALKGARKDFKQFGGDAQKSAKAVAVGVSLAAGAVAALRAGLRALDDATIGAFKEFIQIGDDLATMARDTGVATDELQRLGFIAEQSDITLDTLSKGLTKLTKNAGDAANGNKIYAESFDQLGVKILDADGKLRSRTDLLTDVSVAVSHLGNAEERTAVVTNLFGRSGEKLVGVMQNLADGGAAVNEQFEKFVIPLSDKDIKLAGDIDNIFLRINKQFEGARTRANALIAPEVARLAEQFSNALADALQNGDLLLGIYRHIVIELQDIGVAARLITDTVQELWQLSSDVSEFFGATADETERAATLSEKFALFVAATKDEFRAINVAVTTIGDAITQILLRPIQGFLIALSKVPLIGAEAELALLRAADAAGKFADESFVAADNARAALEGQSEQARLQAEFAKARLDAESDIATLTERAAQRAATEANKLAADGVTTVAARKATEAALIAEKGLQDARDKLRADARARELAQIRQQYDDQLIATRDFFARRADIERAGIDDQIANNRRAQETNRVQFGNAALDVDRAKLDAALAKLQADEEILRRTGAALADQTIRDQRDAAKAASDQYTALVAELATQQGRAIEAQFAATQTALSEQFRQAVQDGDAQAQAAIQELSERATRELQAAQAERTLRAESIQLDGQRAALDVQHERGLLTQIEYEQQIYALENDQLQAERASLEVQLLAAQGNAERTAQLQLQIAEVDAGLTRLTEAQLAFQDSFRSNFQQFFADTIRGAGDTESRLRDLITGFFDDFVNRASQELSEALYKAIVTPVQQGTADAQSPLQAFAGSIVSVLGAAFKSVSGFIGSLFSGQNQGGSGGGILSAIGAAFGGAGGGGDAAAGAIAAGAADGGLIQGPGSNISDSINARLSHGEYVQPARTVSHYGSDVMTAIKNLAIPRDAMLNLTSNAGSGLSRTQRVPLRRNFHDGGPVGVAQQGTGYGTPSVVIENRGTPQRVRSQELDSAGVIRLITEDINNNGPTGQAIAGNFRLNR